jgi:hypothetical protein
MFEQNNIGVRCAHPIAHALSRLTPHKDSALTKKILEGAEKIAHHLDGMYSVLTHLNHRSPDFEH